MSGNGVETKEKKGLFARLFGRGEAPAPQEGPEEGAAPEVPKRSWRERLFGGLFRSSQAISKGIVELFTKRKLDALTLEELEDVLIRADLGVGAASRIAEAVGALRVEKGIEPDEAKRHFVVLVVGVNGSGKTTTIAKLTAKGRGEGKSVLLAAGDTFRAA